MAVQQWRPPKRLRHLEAVSARSLLLPHADPQLRTYFSLSLPPGQDGECCPVYRSEAVCGTLNPEWMPLSWPLDMQLAGEAERVVLAIHQTGADCEQAAMLNVPWIWASSNPQQHPQMAEEEQGTSSAVDRAEPGSPRPALQEQPACKHAASLAEQPDVVAEAAAAPRSAAAGDNSSVELEAPSQEPLLATPPVEQPGEAGVDNTVPRAGPPSAEASADTQAAGLNGRSVDPPGQSPSSSAGTPAAQRQREPDVHPEVLPTIAIRSADEERLVPSDAARAAGAEAAMQALATCPAGAFPGEVVAAWVVDVNRLHFVGEDLAGCREALGPNTVVLELDDGLYVHPPPPEAAGPSLSSQATPTKRGLTLTAERLPASSPAGSAPRRFASMLMSKLLRSTPNLQEVAEGRGAAESDTESEAASEASVSTRFTSHTPGRDLTASTGAVDKGFSTGGGGGMTKAMSAADMSLHIAALVSLRSLVLDLHSRALELRGRLEELGAVRQQAREQELQIREAQQDAQCSRQRAQRAQQRLSQLQQELWGASRGATVRAQALVTTLKVMQAADRKLRDAQESLLGEQGQGRLAGLHRELVARRCLMVCQLGRIFQLGPVTVKVLEAPPGGYLEERLERQWVGSGAGGGGGKQSQTGTPRSLAGSLNGMPPDGGGLDVDTPRQYRQEVHLSIGGIELRPAVWRAAFEETAGADVSPSEDEAAAVALGYVAQFVDRLAVYLDVPLRYPLFLLGSRSSILDGYSPAGTWSTEEPTKRTLFGRAEPASSSSGGGGGPMGGGAAPSEYPLYCGSKRERPQFAVGVFLLNKDISQLLQAHGISAGGPNYLLHNLYKLLCAAQSALPQQV